MGITGFTETGIEEAALAWFEALEYRVLFGPDIAPGEILAEREEYSQVVLERRLREALQRLNPSAKDDAISEAFRKLINLDSPSLVINNHTLHRYLVEGVSVEFRRADNSIGADIIKVIDYENPENNDFLAINQFTVVEDRHERRPDIVIFVNGLPLAVFELKNIASEEADIYSAYKQMQTYKSQIPSLFNYNEAVVVSDGIYGKIGTLTSGWEWFMPWRVIDEKGDIEKGEPDLHVIIEEIFEKKKFLEMIRFFIVFEDQGGGVLAKKMAGYHQRHAANAALESTVKASGIGGDKRAGVIWHTQGSGKSLTMVFYAGRIVSHKDMRNPTIVVLTDRNDLDDQLFGVFARCDEVIRQKPIKAESRANLRALLQTSSGGVIFTTVHKFFPIDDEDNMPLLSERRNIVVIADEAHRSQYDFIDGYARHMRDALPNASFIGFTGTPIELSDKSTRSVFGDYVSIYDIEQAVEDGATVPIYYESRIAKLAIRDNVLPLIDEQFEEVTEGEEVDHKEKLKTKWAQLEAIVGTPERIEFIAGDIVNHFEDRADGMYRYIGDEGKAMIVCMSRRICVDMYNAIVALRPDWHNEDDDKGIVKVIMTGSASDPVDWQEHIRNKVRREQLSKRFKDPKDCFRIVIVRDMWLTGFDAPSLHTMYVDKPMRSHGLMQAIARVNRVFKEKPAGLVVDYLGLANELRNALGTYTASGGKGTTTIDKEEAVTALIEKYEICCGMFYGFDWSSWKQGTNETRLKLLVNAQEHILGQKDGKERFSQAVEQLSKAFALSVPHEKALSIRDDVGFFQAVKAVLAKSYSMKRRDPEEIEYAIRQIVSKAVSVDGVVDVFTAAGLKKPDFSILSEQFLGEIRNMPQKNLAAEVLRKLLEGEIKVRGRKNIVQSRKFSEKLRESILRYQNRAIETAEVMEELLTLAREVRDAAKRGEELGLTEDEIAFYDALEVNDSAVEVLGDDTLKLIAQELLRSVRNSITIDWAVRENVRAKMRVIIKRILRRYGYPPDKQAKATELVLEQAELVCSDLAE